MHRKGMLVFVQSAGFELHLVDVYWRVCYGQRLLDYEMNKLGACL